MHPIIVTIIASLTFGIGILLGTLGTSIKSRAANNRSRRGDEVPEPELIMAYPYKLIVDVPPEEITGPASEDELMEAWKMLQQDLNKRKAYDLHHWPKDIHKPWANISLRKEVAEKMKELIIADNPEALINVCPFDPENDFSEKHNCVMQQIVVAFDKRTLEYRTNRATDW